MPRITIVDLVVLLCLAPLLIVGCWRSTSVASEKANRTKCASHLRAIGQSMLLYANDNRGTLPRIAYVRGADPTPVWGTGGEPNDVSATIFLLIQTQDITPEVFNCPSSNTERDDFGGGTNTAMSRSNFSNVTKNLAYSIHNPYVKDGVVPADDKKYWTAGGMRADFALAADINPGTAGGNDNDDDVRAATPESAPRDIRRANSNNHDKEGQNVLYGDGHVAWRNTPLAGVNRDNIFTAADGRVVASPVDATDSILLPTDD